MESNRRFPLLLSGFWLKIIAIITMTADHIGLAFNFLPLRYIGRLALPLFCFLVVEGVLHTKSFKKYMLRLGIMASAISVIIILTDVIPFIRNSGASMKDAGVIFVDLLLGSLSIYFLQQKKWYLKLLVILPIAFSVVSYYATCHDACGCNGEILWFPYFIRTQYGWFGVTLTIGFYLAHLLTKVFININSSQTGIPTEVYKGGYLERNAINMISVLVLIILSVALYFSDTYMNSVFYLPGNIIDVQVFAIFSGAFILLYNGARGYNGKWFQYGCYLYYPLHLAIIAIITALIYL